MDFYIIDIIEMAISFYIIVRQRYLEKLQSTKEFEGLILTTQMRNGRLCYRAKRKTGNRGDRTESEWIPSRFLTAEVVETLQARHYYSAAAARCERNLNALRRCAKMLKSIDPEQMLTEFTRPYREKHSWIEDVRGYHTCPVWDKYKTDPHFNPEKRKYTTKRGDLVRSKSEMMIADALYVLGIQYVYEPLIVINGIDMHPDFIILSPLDGSEIIWEHFGMMSFQDYQNKAVNSLRIYFSGGYLPDINMITTYENSDGGLDSFKIDRILNDWFGNEKQFRLTSTQAAS